ncbi:hypothetical protein N1851_016568 [Merluccius polli]|uniref:RIMS-binding protein 1/2/3 Fn3 domain-containing protein n=1 Tax=Merluccius polli TaxID=89951 RepID=A0AA47NZM3_MERPO|nr:hypothetical protein N1851_016568 [Merluccius polli]
MRRVTLAGSNRPLVPLSPALQTLLLLLLLMLLLLLLLLLLLMLLLLPWAAGLTAERPRPRPEVRFTAPKVKGNLGRPKPVVYERAGYNNLRSQLLFKVPSRLPTEEAPGEVGALEVIRTVGQSGLMIGWERPPLDDLGCSNGTFVYGYRVYVDGDFHKSVMSSACTKASKTGWIPPSQDAVGGCILENVDLSLPVHIGVQTLGSNGLSSGRHRVPRLSPSDSDCGATPPPLRSPRRNGAGFAPQRPPHYRAHHHHPADTSRLPGGGGVTTSESSSTPSWPVPAAHSHRRGLKVGSLPGASEQMGLGAQRLLLMNQRARVFGWRELSMVSGSMAGCAKRCKQGLVKFAVSLHRLVTGTLIKVEGERVRMRWRHYKQLQRRDNIEKGIRKTVLFDRTASPVLMGSYVGQRDKRPLLALQHLYQHQLVSHPRMNHTSPAFSFQEKPAVRGSQVKQSSQQLLLPCVHKSVNNMGLVVGTFSMQSKQVNYRKGLCTQIVIYFKLPQGAKLTSPKSVTFHEQHCYCYEICLKG